MWRVIDAGTYSEIRVRPPHSTRRAQPQGAMKGAAADLGESNLEEDFIAHFVEVTSTFRCSGPGAMITS